MSRLRKHAEARVKLKEGLPQGLKPSFIFSYFAARLKSCSDTKRATVQP